MKLIAKAGTLPVTDVAMQDLRQGPAILVTPFVDDSAATAHPALSLGFTRELIAGLTRFNDLFVFGPETAFRLGDTADARGMAVAMGGELILTGGQGVSSDRFRGTATLVEGARRRDPWSGRVGGGRSSILPDRPDALSGLGCLVLLRAAAGRGP